MNKKESTTRPRAKVNLGNIGDFKSPKKENSSSDLAAKAEGFTARHSNKPSNTDARKLRATGRNVQFNIAVKPETKDKFWKLAKENGFTKGEEFLLFLMHELES